jgi:hypothetical protein
MNNTVVGQAIGAGGISAKIPQYLVWGAPVLATALIALLVYGRTQIADSLVDTTIVSNTTERGERV